MTVSPNNTVSDEVNFEEGIQLETKFQYSLSVHHAPNTVQNTAGRIQMMFLTEGNLFLLSIVTVNHHSLQGQMGIKIQ